MRGLLDGAVRAPLHLHLFAEIGRCVQIFRLIGERIIKHDDSQATPQQRRNSQATLPQGSKKLKDRLPDHSATLEQLHTGIRELEELLEKNDDDATVESYSEKRRVVQDALDGLPIPPKKANRGKRKRS